MGIGAHACVGVGNRLAVDFFCPNGLTEIFKVHLVTNASAGRNHAEILKCRGTPAKEFVALSIAFILALNVLFERLFTAEMVHHHGVINHQIDRHLRVDHISAAAELLGRIPHRRQVHNRRNAGEILHQHAGRTISNLVTVFAFVIEPLLESDDVILGDGTPVFMAQHILQKDLQRRRQARHIAQTIFPCRLKRVVGIRLAIHIERAFGVEAIE